MNIDDGCKPKKGDVLYHCFFWANDISKFVIKQNIFDELRTDKYSSTLWCYDKDDSLISNLNNCSLSPEQAIRDLKNSLEVRQDEEKEEWKEEQKQLLKRIDKLKYNWLEKDSEINNKIQYLMSKLKEIGGK